LRRLDVEVLNLNSSSPPLLNSSSPQLLLSLHKCFTMKKIGVKKNIFFKKNVK
jgi:hypothetical protein